MDHAADRPQRSLLVLYASETGTAQDVAERIAREGRRRWFVPTVLSMDEYDRSRLIDEPLVVFVCSTTGQGSEPASMTKFWKFLLRKSHPHNILSNTRIAVFGLGDSSYPKFNFPAKKLHKRLVAGLGAVPVVERGDGDDQHYLGVDGGLDPWLEDLWAKLLTIWPLPLGKEIVSADIVPLPSFEISFAEMNGGGDPVDGMFDQLGLNKHVPSATASTPRLTAVVNVNQRITAPDHFQDVRHFEFTVDQPTHNAGDIMVVFPHNLPDEIALVIAHFGWTDVADKPFTLKPTSPDIHLPLIHHHAPLTIRHLLTHHLDIFGRPRRYFFHLLSFFTTDPLHASKLRELASPQGQQELYSYAHRPRRTMFEILQDFHSAKVPLKYLLDLIPPIRPRNFSIASSPTTHPTKIHLCVAIIEYTTKMKAPRTGVCTKWMKHLQPGNKITYSIKRGTLRLPSPDKPLILVGPGTGIAPMRALLHERTTNGLTDNTVVFGCRYQNKDFLYADELTALERAGALKLLTAFSRDQDSKIYVQHRIAQNSALVYDTMVARKGTFLLSGNASRMPVDVTAALVECVMRETGVKTEQAEEVVKTWEKEGRFQMECWS
ncbi:hypothetical protein PhCBS80983_g04625 [Powellomyces hirtus]|uniref:NADPH-dependent diflavin oxidoreductase 1 n=1 Tax=Powellomyces hirtus TaxID=109895 RepID=A0A507DXP7_9FUNG|nr:hypothetical protein PhCBS80983_g04625 [Powellomyces hirtus]